MGVGERDPGKAKVYHVRTLFGTSRNIPRALGFGELFSETEEDNSQGENKTPFEQAIESATGMTVEHIRQTPLCDLRKEKEAISGPVKIVPSSEDIFSRDQVENLLDEALK